MMMKGLSIVKRAFGMRYLQLQFAFLFFLSMTPIARAAPIPLSLNDALNRMTSQSPSIQLAAMTLDSSRIAYDIAWYTFWLPALDLTAISNYNHSFASLPFSDARNDPTYKMRGPPNNTVSIGLGSFILFDFFKERARFDLAKIQLESAEQTYQENMRRARFDLIKTYFETKIAQEKYEASEGSVKIAQAIVENIEIKKKLNKATEDELTSSSVDLNNAKIDLLQKKTVFAQNLLTLNTLLNASGNTEFQLTTDLPFQIVRLDERELFDIYKKSSPEYRIQENNVTASEVNVSLAEKNRLPLPTITLAPLKVDFNTGFSGNSAPIYRTGTDIDDHYGAVSVSASIEVRIPIFGPNGFFNERPAQIARIQRDQSEIQFHMIQMQREAQIKQSILNIRTLEQNLVTQKESINRNQDLLNSFFRKTTSAGVDRLQLRDAVLQARQSQFDYYDSLYYHLISKFDLAQLVGLDRLPGDTL
jgi:outer membrane protein TolC